MMIRYEMNNPIFFALIDEGIPLLKIQNVNLIFCVKCFSPDHVKFGNIWIDYQKVTSL